MLYPSTILFGSFLVANVLGFAFITIPPTHNSVGKRWVPRSASSSLAYSQTTRRVGRTTLEPKRYWRHQDSRRCQNRRSDTTKVTGALAAAESDDDGEEVFPTRSPVVASSTNEPERICVLGGGFGGLYTALRLQKMPWRGRKPIVTLVDKRDKFTFLPLLYEFAIGNAELDEVAPTFRELLAGSGVSFVQGCVSDVDLDDKKVSVVGAVADDLDGFMISDNADQARTIKYDKMVLAVGAEPASGIDKVPGAREHAIPFYSIEDSYRVKQAITKLKVLAKEAATVRVVVVGGSYAGVELSCNLATELSERKGMSKVEVTLATGSEVLSSATPSNREAGLRRLKESGVNVMMGTRVAEVKKGGVVVLQQSGEKEGPASADGEELEANLLVWTAGSQPSTLVESLDVQKDSKGRIEVDRRLRLVSGVHDDGNGGGRGGDVYCLGDIATVEGMDLGCTAQVAIQQSDYVAYNIWADKDRRKPLDFRFLDLGEVMNLGGLDGAVSALGGRVKLTGKAAGLARRAIYAVRMPTNPQRVRAAASAAAGTAFSITSAVLEKGMDILERT